MIHHIGCVNRVETLQCLQVPELDRAIITTTNEERWIASAEGNEGDNLLVSMKHIQLHWKCLAFLTMKEEVRVSQIRIVLS